MPGFSAVLVLQQNIADLSSKTDQATIRPRLFHRGKVGQGVSRECALYVRIWKLNQSFKVFAPAAIVGIKRFKG
jgi:hypothetical protein